ncbi:MAG: ubiquinone anaerobic biosynthesis accessory factor UbiT [Burkholderiales bacterium]
MKLPELPRAAARLGAALPQYPPTALFSVALNALLPRLFADDEIARLEGRTVCIEVRDAGMRLTLRIDRKGYTACDGRTVPDATISAAVRDYVQLALRNADPDTLFFGRRLTISGDTDVGLIVKNALDRIEPPLPQRLLQALQKHIQ